MVQQYSCTVDAEVKKSKKALQWAGIFAILFSLGFVIFSIFFSWYFMIAFAFFFVGGIVNIHFYNNVKKEYLYELSETRLTIVGKDVVNRQKRLATVLLKDVIEFKILSDTSDNLDGLFCSNAYDAGVYSLSFNSESGVKTFAFMPDDYMIALLKEEFCGKSIKR